MQPYTTFEVLKRNGACKERYRHLAKACGGIGKYCRNKPIPLVDILRHNGLDDAIWALRAVPDDQSAHVACLARMFAVACARDVQHLMTDARSLAALDVAERHARGEATDEALGRRLGRRQGRPSHALRAHLRGTMT